jgi:two-component system response regulator
MKSISRVDILVVDDSDEDRALTSRALGRLNPGLVLLAVRDGTEAVKAVFDDGFVATQVRLCRPKLILLDLKMPLMDGYEFLLKIKSDTRTRTIPVVVFTSSAEESDIEICYRLGANSYIVKPVDSLEFKSTVAAVGDFWMTINKQI